MIRTILHGGLGNQLYQLFYSELLAGAFRADVSLVSACLGRYAVGRGMELAPLIDGKGFVSTSSAMTLVERLRLPKVIQRATGSEMPLRLGVRRAIVDGYFQSSLLYQRFDPALIAKLLDEWRERLGGKGIVRSPHRSHLTHIRLTDFVAEGHSPQDLAAPKVAAMPRGGMIMTDDEASVLTVLRSVFGPEGEKALLSTNGLTSWEVLSAMSEFEVVETNGSSLACWAAILSGGRLQSANADHAEFARFCTAAQRGQDA